MPVEDQRAEHRPQDADGILILSAAIHVSRAEPIPFPPATGKRVTLRLTERPAQSRLHLVDVLDVQVIVARMAGEEGLIRGRLGTRASQQQKAATKWEIYS